MKKELFLAVIISVLLLIVFITGVFITEKRNTDFLRSHQNSSGQILENGRVSIPAVGEKEFRYQRNKVIVWIIRILMSFVIPSVFLFTGWSAGIRNWAVGKVSKFILAAALYFVVYSLIDYAASLPLDFYSGFVRPHNYGLSSQTALKWFSDSVKSFIIFTSISAAFIWIPFLIIKRAPGRWWLYLGLLSIPVFLFISYASPLYIDPLFNKFGPVKDAVLDAEIHAQLSHTIIGDCDVFEVDKSTDTKEMNAYMTGVFNSERIVLWDTTIKQLTHKEMLGVVAHEMGHFLMGHVWKTTVLGGLLCIAVLWLVGRVSLWIIGKSGGVFGLERLHDIAAFPLLILVINIFMFIAAPGINAYSRHMETEADRFELELTRDNAAAASSTVKLHQGSLMLPRPGLIYMLWNYDHPAYQDRLDFANNYKPWSEGKPIKYKKYIVNGKEY